MSLFLIVLFPNAHIRELSSVCFSRSVMPHFAPGFVPPLPGVPPVMPMPVPMPQVPQMSFGGHQMHFPPQMPPQVPPQVPSQVPPQPPVGVSGGIFRRMFLISRSRSRARTPGEEAEIRGTDPRRAVHLAARGVFFWRRGFAPLLSFCRFLLVVVIFSLLLLLLLVWFGLVTFPI